MPTEKRARKKEFRDARVAAQQATLRRQRTARLLGVGLVVAALIALALFYGQDDESPAAGTEPTPTPQEITACGADAPPPPQAEQYEGPRQVMERGIDYSALIRTSCGDIALDLLEEETPETVNNFIFLAREGFFEGVIWHRIESNFVIQTGDPNGNAGIPPQGPGYSIEDEFPEKSREYVYGVVAMANSGQPNSGGSQFFIVVHKGPNGEFEPAGLPPQYSIFGLVDESSYETLETIRTLPTRGGNDPVEAVRPIENVYIEVVEIHEA